MATTAEMAAWWIAVLTVLAWCFIWKTGAVERILTGSWPAPAPVAAEPAAATPLPAPEIAQDVAPSPPTPSPQPRKILSNPSEALPPRLAHSKTPGICNTEQHTRKRQTTSRTDGFRLDAQPRLLARRSKAVLKTEMVLTEPAGYEQIEKPQNRVRTAARKNLQPTATRVAPRPVGQCALPVVSAELSPTVSATTTKPVEDKVPTLPSPSPTPITQSVKQPLPTAVPGTWGPSQVENETSLTVPKLLKRQQSRAAAKSTGCTQHIKAAGPQKIAKSGKSTKHRVLLGCKHYAVSTIPSKRKALVRTRRSFVRMELPESPEILDICTKLSEVTLAAPYTALTPKETAPYTYSVWPYDIHDIVWAELAKHASQLKADDGGDKMVTDDDMPATVLQQGQADTLSEDKMEIEPTTTPSNRQSTQQVTDEGLDRSIHAPSTPYMSPAPTTNTSFGAAIPFNQTCTPAVGQAAATQTPAAPKKNGPVPFQITPSLSSNAGLVQQPAGSGVQPDDTMEIEQLTPNTAPPKQAAHLNQPSLHSDFASTQPTVLSFQFGTTSAQFTSPAPKPDKPAAPLTSLAPSTGVLPTNAFDVPIGNGASHSKQKKKGKPPGSNNDQPTAPAKSPDDAPYFTVTKGGEADDGRPTDRHAPTKKQERGPLFTAIPADVQAKLPAPSFFNAATSPAPTSANSAAAPTQQPTDQTVNGMFPNINNTAVSSSSNNNSDAAPTPGLDLSTASSADQTTSATNNAAATAVSAAAGSGSPSTSGEQSSSLSSNALNPPREIPGLASTGAAGVPTAGSRSAAGATNTFSLFHFTVNTASNQASSNTNNTAAPKPSFRGFNDGTFQQPPSRPAPVGPQNGATNSSSTNTAPPSKQGAYNNTRPQPVSVGPQCGVAHSSFFNTVPPFKQGAYNNVRTPSPLSKMETVDSDNTSTPPVVNTSDSNTAQQYTFPETSPKDSSKPNPRHRYDSASSTAGAPGPSNAHNSLSAYQSNGNGTASHTLNDEANISSDEASAAPSTSPTPAKKSKQTPVYNPQPATSTTTQQAPHFTDEMKGGHNNVSLRKATAIVNRWKDATARDVSSLIKLTELCKGGGDWSNVFPYPLEMSKVHRIEKGATNILAWLNHILEEGSKGEARKFIFGVQLGNGAFYTDLNRLLVAGKKMQVDLQMTDSSFECAMLAINDLQGMSMST